MAEYSKQGLIDDQIDIKLIKQQEFNANVVKRLEELEDFENGLTIKDEDENQIPTYWIPTDVGGISKRVHIDEKVAHLQHKADILLNEINRLNKLKEKHG